MTHQTDDPLDAEYRELTKLAGPDGCKCGIPGCPGHEVIDGKIFIDTRPLGPLVIEIPDKGAPGKARKD